MASARTLWARSPDYLLICFRRKQEGRQSISDIPITTFDPIGKVLTWTGDFSGAGRTAFLGYYPRNHDWRLRDYQGASLALHYGETLPDSALPPKAVRSGSATSRAGIGWSCSSITPAMATGFSARTMDLS
jgi:hypothetical protein